MNAAPVLVASSVGVFALMIALFGPTEAASMTLFPVGVVLALAALGVGISGAVRARGAERAANAAAAGFAALVLALAALALLWALWVFGVFGNAWG